MGLDIGREVKLNQVIFASELFRRLSDAEMTWTFEALHYDCNALLNALKENGFDNTCESVDAQQLEGYVDRLNKLHDEITSKAKTHSEADEEIQAYLPGSQLWSSGLYNEFQNELDAMPFCLATARSPGVNEWFEIEKQFPEGDFSALPLTARRSFREAGRCFLFEQFTASAVMSMRAAEAVLREYYYRLKLEEPGEKDGWGDSLSRLSISNEVLKQMLENGRVLRNTLVHPRVEFIQADAGNAQDCFNQARAISRALTQDLVRLRKAVSVGVCLSFPDGRLSVDVLIALWLLNNHKSGIGRLLFLDPDDPDFLEPDFEQYDFLLGMGSNRFNLEVGKSYALSIANELGVTEQHEALLDYCEQWMAATSDERPLDAVAVYEHTLEGMVEAIHLYYAPKDKKPELWCKRIFQLFSQVKQKQLAPGDVDLATRITLSGPKEAITYLRTTRQANAALNKKEEITYEALRGVVAAIAATEFESFSRELFDQGYQLIALTDEVQSLWIETNMKTTSLVRIINALRQKIGDIGRLDLQKNRIRQKQPVQLTARELKECIEMAAA